MNDYLKCLKEKRIEVFGIDDYDYIVSDKGQTETLRIGTTKIGFSCNSIYAVVQELVDYLFICYFKERSLGHFKTQVFNQIKCFWLEK